MADKSVNNLILDAALNYIKSNATKMTICTSEPTTYNQAVLGLSSAGFALADVVISSADFTGPADDTSGRKLTTNAQTSITIDSTGSAAHVALVDVSSTVLLFVTTCTSQTLTAANKVNTPSWVYNLRDPV